MELIYDIAEALDVPNDWIAIDMVHDGLVWFSVQHMKYWGKTKHNDKRLKKNSIRPDV